MYSVSIHNTLYNTKIKHSAGSEYLETSKKVPIVALNHLIG